MHYIVNLQIGSINISKNSNIYPIKKLDTSRKEYVKIYYTQKLRYVCYIKVNTQLKQNLKRIFLIFTNFFL